MINDLYLWATLTRHRRGLAHFCKQERKVPTPVPRRLNRIYAVLAKAIPGGWVPISGMKLRSLVVLSSHVAFFRWITQSAALLFLSKDGLMSCCAAGKSGCLNLWCRAFPPGRQVRSESSRCPGSMALCAGGSAAPFQRSSASGMPASIGRLAAGAGRSDPFAVRKEFMRRSMRLC